MVSLIDFECPYSFYNINENNNQFNVSTSASTLNITIPPSNYDVDTMTDYLNNQFANNETALGTLLVVSFSFSTNKFTIISDTLDFTILDTTTMLREFGLASVPVTSSLLQFTSPNVCNFAGTPYVELLSSLAITNLASHEDKQGVIARVPVRTEPTDFIFHQATENIYHMLDDRHIDNIRITLRDSDKNVLELNGGVFSISLSMHFQYQRTPTQFNQFQMADAYRQIFEERAKSQQKTEKKD